MELEIKGFLETSFLDWDGKVVSTLYLPFCNFRCPFCHNSGLIEFPQSYETIPLVRIQKFLVERRDFIDGICLTGGEPCLHKDRGLFEFMRQIKGLGFQIKLDTNGSDPECLKKAIEEKLIDCVAMDIKGPLDERYDRLSGVKTDLDKIRRSIKIIMESGIPYEFRVTVVPALLDAKDIEDVARTLAGAKKLVFQQFAPENAWDPALRSVKPYDKIIMKRLVEAAKIFVPNTTLRGV